MITLEVLGIRLASGEDSPVLLLKDKSGSRVLPIWIAAVDAAAIAVALDRDSTFSRPLTHDLLASVITELIGEGKVGRAEIIGVVDGVFQARLLAGEHSFDVRPSDAVALVLRLGWQISCTEHLMDQVGVELEEPSGDEVERFREFLESVNPDDFEPGASGE